MLRAKITDDVVKRLLSGDETEEISIGDVSDVQLYGRMQHRHLTGSDEQSALMIGCKPIVYQSIYWWTLAWIPVVPLKSYAVLPYLESKDGGEYDSYRAVPMSMHRSQVALHYAVSCFVIVASVMLIWWGVHWERSKF